MAKTTIADSSVRVLPSKKLLDLIDTHKDILADIPTNLAIFLKKGGCNLPSTVETLEGDFFTQWPMIDIKLLSSIRKESLDYNENNKIKEPEEKPRLQDSQTANEYLYLNDLLWLNKFLARLRKEYSLDVYLHQLLRTSEIVLPENETIERNPVLEARCEKLRQEQQNREYMKMTKNVDSVLKNYPEDTIAYQMKALNKQIIAVVQFVVSVVAGFVFGFIGLELIFGGLDFGLRLLMGIMFALIIALAEIYFLAKKLNEYDEDVTNIKRAAPNCLNQSPAKNKKVHGD